MGFGWGNLGPVGPRKFWGFEDHFAYAREQIEHAKSQLQVPNLKIFSPLDEEINIIVWDWGLGTTRGKITRDFQYRWELPGESPGIPGNITRGKKLWYQLP